MWLALWALLVLVVRLLFVPPREHLPQRFTLPGTFEGFLRSPLPLIARGVTVTAEGGPCDVMNHAAALAFLRHARQP